MKKMTTNQLCMLAFCSVINLVADRLHWFFVFRFIWTPWDRFCSCCDGTGLWYDPWHYQ